MPDALPDWEAAAAADLGLVDVAFALGLDQRYAERVRSILTRVCDQPRVIAYRQAILSDFLDDPALCSALQPLLATLAQLGALANPARPRESALSQVVYRLGELELYVDCVRRLSEALGARGGGPASEGLRALRDHVAAVEDDPSFQTLCAELPTLIEKVRNIGSVTLGVNLDAQLQPVEATLVSINAQRYKGATSSLLARLLGAKVSDESLDADEAGRGLAQLHRVALPEGMPANRENLMLVPLFRDLSELLEATAKPVAQSLMRFTRISARTLTAIDAELAFYLGAAALIRRMRAAGLPMCRPDIAPADERCFELRDGYNLVLGLRMLGREAGADLRERIVTNDIAFDDAARVFILTGPNRGGKTTYIQAIGLAHVLAQAGLWLPGTSARLSPCDGVFTHFATEERPELDAGRLGEEARRLSEIFAKATRRSLVLLNESLSSTSPTESLVLARDVARALRLLGARAVFATHLHGLAEDIDAINAETPGDSVVVSLVSQAVEGEDGAMRTFKIVRAPPQGMSYARDIARRYGISYEQLAQTVIEHRAASGE